MLQDGSFRRLSLFSRTVPHAGTSLFLTPRASSGKGTVEPKTVSSLETCHPEIIVKNLLYNFMLYTT